MRPLEPGSFKKFFDSSFLSDFTLIISCEPTASEPAAPAEPDAALTAAAVDVACNSSSSSSSSTHSQGEQGLQHHVEHELLPAAACSGPSTPPAADTAAALDQAAPCSGQHQGGFDSGEEPCSSTPQQQQQQEAAVDALVKRDSANSLAQQAAGSSSSSATAATLHSIRSSSTNKLQSYAAATAGTARAASSAVGSSTYVSDSGGSSSSDAQRHSSSSSSSGGCIVLPVHGVVLAAASPYFETLLRDWKSSSGSSSSSSTNGVGGSTLHMVVAEEQVSAAQLLLGFMYTGSIPPGISQHDLLQLLLLADRFDVRRAAAAASRVLGCLSPAALEWGTLSGVYCLQEHLYEADEQAPLRQVAWDRLLQLFGDLEDSWASADGRALFQQLPLRAVAALAKSDSLAVASENTVFAALSSWVAHAAGVYGRALSPRDLQQLAASVRLPGMGPCYLSYVALQHDWFRLSLDVAALARAAAFSAAAAEVRADFLKHTRDSVNAAEKAAAVAAAAGHAGDGGGAAGSGSSSSGQAGGRASSSCCTCSGELMAFTAAGAAGSSSSSSSSSVIAPGAPAGPWGLSSSSGRFCSWCQQQQSCSADQQLQLLQLAHAAQRPRAASCKRSCFFQWHVDMAAIRQLYEEVAAAGSRDSRILRSPAHSHAGYEWALQLEITQTKGATGFDGGKPWALGVFLTCQVRVEVPARQPAPEAAAAGAAAAAAGSSAAGEGSGSGCVGSKAAVVQQQQQQQQQASAQVAQPGSPLLMQLVDFGFVSTAATISVREVGGKDKRCEKSWEHATVRYRASWGWPNYLDVQATGWDEAAFERWVIDGQMHLQANVRLLG
uniref:BTB domain-containing protein n=1 Tax=Tetradesmus obliquus TaxID=3088 RepID=A0A383VWS6_TETOB|eukprot:jgi/Sobl393_1/18938/SZX69935.1